MSRRSIAVLVIWASAVLLFTGGASARDKPVPSSLNGETYVAVGGVTITSKTCNPTGTSSFSYEITGTATPPYPGTYHEEGTVVFGPQNIPGGVLFGRITAWDVTFNISPAAGDPEPIFTEVTGTKYLAPDTSAAQLPAATCTEAAVFARVNNEFGNPFTGLRYEATITSDLGTAQDQGDAGAFVARGEPFSTVAGGSTGVFISDYGEYLEEECKNLKEKRDGTKCKLS